MLASNHGQQGTQAVHGVSGECRSLWKKSERSGSSEQKWEQAEGVLPSRNRSHKAGPGRVGLAVGRAAGEAQDPWAGMRAVRGARRPGLRVVTASLGKL